MRLLHLTHQYAPDYVGGVELYTQMLAERQVAQGHHVAVFTTSPSANTLLPAAVEAGVHVYRAPIGKRNRLAVFLSSFGQRQVAQALTQTVAREQPDIIHIQHLIGLPLKAIAKLKQTIPYLITLHDYWYLCANAQLIRNSNGQVCIGPDSNFYNCGHCALARAGLKSLAPLSPLVVFLMGWRNRQLLPILHQASRVIAPTHFVRQIYQAQGAPADNMVVVRHGIDIPLARLAKIRQERPYQPQQPLHVGYVGSIAWQKGVHLLVDAVNQLPPDAIRLTLFGGLTDFPEYVAGLRREATHPGIHFAGRVNRDELWPHMATLDLLVMPTLWYEASPLTIDEAFALGLPILAANIGAMGEKIRDGIDGRLFPPGNVRALRTVLTDLTANPEQLIAFHKAIRPVQAIDNHLEEITTIYRQITS